MAKRAEYCGDPGVAAATEYPSFASLNPPAGRRKWGCGAPPEARSVTEAAEHLGKAARRCAAAAVAVVAGSLTQPLDLSLATRNR